ncbi:MAG: hypothetical protein H5U40_12505, partial [Polyangiaceae bacterium]|nr:hypothetical protein [Polyangiaceae bacterium]
DAPAPTLALPTDRAKTHPKIGLVADAAAALVGAYGPRVGFAVGMHQAVWVAPSFVRGFGRRGASLEVVYAVMPLGRGLEGLRIAAFASAAYYPTDEPVRSFRAGAEAGYAHTWGRLFLGGAMGAASSVVFTVGGQGERSWHPIVRAELGVVFL